MFAGWHNYSIVTFTVAGTNVQHLLALLLKGHWHGSSKVAGTIAQQSLGQFFKSCWLNFSIVTSMSLVSSLILKQPLTRLLKS